MATARLRRSQEFQNLLAQQPWRLAVIILKIAQSLQLNDDASVGVGILLHQSPDLAAIAHRTSIDKRSTLGP
jgi:hypothetical protein